MEARKGFSLTNPMTLLRNSLSLKTIRTRGLPFELEGVYMNAMVYINGDFAGQCPYGYSNFYIKADKFLKYGQENEIKVVVKPTMIPVGTQEREYIGTQRLWLQNRFI